MTILRNFPIEDFGQDAHIAWGTGVLTPDAGGGFFGQILPGFRADSLVLAAYNGNAAFVGANAGFLLCSYDEPSSSLLVISSNIADNNSIRWLIAR